MGLCPCSLSCHLSHCHPLLFLGWWLLQFQQNLFYTLCGHCLACLSGPFLAPNRAFLVPVGTPASLRVGCGNAPPPLTPILPSPELRSCFGRRSGAGCLFTTSCSPADLWLQEPGPGGYGACARPHRNMEWGLCFAVGPQCRSRNRGRGSGQAGERAWALWFQLQPDFWGLWSSCSGPDWQPSYHEGESEGPRTLGAELPHCPRRGVGAVTQSGSASGEGGNAAPHPESPWTLTPGVVSALLPLEAPVQPCHPGNDPSFQERVYKPR